MRRSAYLAFLYVLVLCFCGRPETPEQPQFRVVEVCPLPGYAENIDVANGYAYVADGQAGLQIVNVTDPESTYIAGGFLTTKSAQGIAVRDSLAFVALSSGAGLVIINVANPSQCSLIASDGGYTEYDICAPLNSFYIYIAALDYFIVENCSLPQYPFWEQRLTTPGNVHGVFVGNGMAYIACEEMGVQIYRSALPDSEIALLSSIDTPSNARDIFVVDDHVYVADGRAGLVVIDISEPATPEICGTYDTPGYANNVVVAGGYAYVADGDGGLQIIEISNPLAPVLYAEVETSYASAVFVDDTLIYVADRDQGLIIITEEHE